MKEDISIMKHTCEKVDWALASRGTRGQWDAEKVKLHDWRQTGAGSPSSFLTMTFVFLKMLNFASSKILKN